MSVERTVGQLEVAVGDVGKQVELVELVMFDRIERGESQSMIASRMG